MILLIHLIEIQRFDENYNIFFLFKKYYYKLNYKNLKLFSKWFELNLGFILNIILDYFKSLFCPNMKILEKYS